MKIWKIYFYIMLAVTIIATVIAKSLILGIMAVAWAIAYTIGVPFFIWAAMEVYKAFKK